MRNIADQLFYLIIIGLFMFPFSVNSSQKNLIATNGLTWQWEYDREGRLEKLTAPGNMITRLTYTASKIQKNKAYTTTVTVGNEERKLTYDEENRLLMAKSAGGTTRFVYNKFGLPTEVHSSKYPSLHYKYDLYNRLVKMEVGNSIVIQYRYDFLGRLAAVYTPAGEITYSYHRVTNTVVRRLPNGLQTLRKYDSEGNLIKLTHANVKNQVIAVYAYSYRPDGLIDQIDETTQRNGKRECRYKYNLMHRLTDVECGGRGDSYHYQYDSHGNLAESRVPGAQMLKFSNTPAGALATDSRGPIRIDERGHIRELPNTAASTDYGFNDIGELATAKKQSIQYTYNALGQMTSRKVAGKETQYLPDPFGDAWQPLWLRDAEGNETITIWDGAVPLLELKGKEILYHLEDYRGSVRLEADGTGKIISWHDYSPYGEPEEAIFDNELVAAYAGLYWDPVAQVYLTKVRAYDPVTARFLQPDPKLRIPNESKHSHSLYAYSGGDPVNFVDRDGADAIPASSHLNWNSLGEVGINIGTYANHFISEARENYLESRIKYYSPKEPTDKPQQFDTSGEAKRWFVNTLHLYELEELRKPEYKGREFSQLSRDQRIKVRNTALDRFGSNFTDIPFVHQVATFGSSKYLEDFNKYVANMNILTEDGWTSLDWFATIIRTSKIPFSSSDPMEHLKFGKRFWNWLGPRIGRKMMPEKGNELPQNNLNIIPLIKRLQNPDISIASAVFVPHGSMGVSVVAYSRPLSKQEYQEWKQSDKKKRDDVYDSLISSFFGGSPGPGGGGSWGSSGGGLGGPGQGGGPWGAGGGGGPGGGGSSFSMQSPSPVGGVYLDGAGKILEGLDQIKGVAVDNKSGKLVLIGFDNDQIDLPPLRLDDVVTVFRAVYDYGASPSVTIDPDEKNPTGPTMDVKHGPGTEATYVGWILFECDRIMKAYQLGEDNVTRQAIVSKISDYTDILKAVYFGDETKAVNKKVLSNSPDGNWERFWIVPAAVKRFDTRTNGLSLFELPLKVNTQKMRWEKGKLVDDQNGNSSYGANTFKTWFSKHYDAIADEVFLTPPPGSGFGSPVAIFHELRRIALITAIAEHLRDSGKAFPTWMRDYKVKSFPVSETTPSLNISKKKVFGSVIQTANIYGGVDLAPADEDVYVYSKNEESGVATVAKEHVAFVKLSKKEAVSLNSKIPKLIHAQDGIGKVQILQTSDNNTFSAAILPGANTEALAPNRQVVTDMVVDIGLGRNISLTRYYNSFFDPVGELGAGWTFDLPRLLMTRIPEKRDGKRVQYRLVPQMVSPLGTVDIRFDKIDKVEPFGVNMYVAKDHPEVVGVSEAHNPIDNEKTHLALFRDGTEWHFNDHGRLVLVRYEGTATRYVWDSKERVRQVVGYIGQDVVADIKLGYDSKDRIISADAKQVDFLKRQLPAEVSKLTFEYNADGRLNKVINFKMSESGVRQVEWTYTYEANHLTQIARADGTEVSFGYDAHGQLLWDKQGSRKREYSLNTAPRGSVLAYFETGARQWQTKWTYDERMRVVKAQFGVNKQIQWKYGKKNEVTETVYQDDKLVLTRSTSQDGSSETTTLADGSTFKVQSDAYGNPTTLFVNGVYVAKVTWQLSGRFAGLRTDNTEMQPRWHEDGWQKGIVISAPLKSGKSNQWLEYEWDLMQRPTRITDSSGYNYMMHYDEQGRIDTFGRITKQKELVGARLNYNDKGLITDIQSTWGSEKREYTNNGMLENVVVKRRGATSETTFDAHGRPAHHLTFDGGKTTWQYESDMNSAKLKRIVLPNKEQINYVHHEIRGTSKTDVNLDSVVVSTYLDEEYRVKKIIWDVLSP